MEKIKVYSSAEVHNIGGCLKVGDKQVTPAHISSIGQYDLGTLDQLLEALQDIRDSYDGNIGVGFYYDDENRDHALEFTTYREMTTEEKAKWQTEKDLRAVRDAAEKWKVYQALKTEFEGK